MSRINVENIRHPDASSDSLQLSNTGNITAPGNLSVTGTSTLTDDLVVDTDTLFVDVSTDRVGINRTPGSQLDVQGANCNFRITSNDGNTSCNLQTIESAEVRFGPTTNSALAIYTNGVEEARFLSGGGLTFNGDTAAANALDDYEEGTWTPAFNRAGTTRTHSLQSGFYTKVGNKVSVTFEVELSAFSQGGSGQYSIQGLPFASDNRGNYGGSLDVWGGVTLSSGFTKLGVMANGSSTIVILMQSSNTGGAPDTSGVTYATSNVILRGQFNYWSGS